MLLEQPASAITDHPHWYSTHLYRPQAIIATPVATVPLCEIKFDLCRKNSTFHLGTLFHPIAYIGSNRLSRRAALDTHFDQHMAWNASSRLVRLQTAVAHPTSVPCSFLAAHGKVEIALFAAAHTCNRINHSQELALLHSSRGAFDEQHQPTPIGHVAQLNRLGHPR